MSEFVETGPDRSVSRPQLSRLIVWGICSGVILVLTLVVSITGKRAVRLSSTGDYLEEPTVRLPVREIWRVMSDELPDMGQPWLLEATYWVAIVVAGISALGLLWLAAAPVQMTADSQERQEREIQDLIPDPGDV